MGTKNPLKPPLLFGAHGSHLIHASLDQPHSPPQLDIRIPSAISPQYTFWTDRLTDRLTDGIGDKSIPRVFTLCYIDSDALIM